VGAADIVPGRGERYPHYWKLAAEASLLALEDAGLTTKDVDGVVFARSGEPPPYPAFPTSFCQYMGITPAWMETQPHGGCPMGAMMWRAALGLLAGFCNTCLVVCTDNRQSRLSRRGVVRNIAAHNFDTEFEYPYGPLVPSTFALLAQRHMHEYGTTREQIAAVAVAGRQWARLHPQAVMKEPLTIEDVMTSRIISSPLRLLDISLVTDGGGALVMARSERARDFPKRPVYVEGFGECGESQNVTYMSSLTEPHLIKTAARQAFGMAGLSARDMDIAFPYDPSTISVIWALEDLGFCKKGEGGPFVAEGHIAPGGRLPVNTHGGMLSYSHPGISGGFLGIIEAVRQLRGEAGARQVKNAKHAVTHQMGGMYNMGVTILGNGR
jgi:acetyl-CoA acetyltransferase